MKIRKVLVSDIVHFLRDVKYVLRVDGGPITNDLYIDNIADAAHINATSLDWINPSKEEKQEITEKSNARVLLVDGAVVYNDVLKEEGKVLLVVDNPKTALALVAKHFFIDKIIPAISDKAEIHFEAQIGENVSIGAFCVIGKCVIGDNTIIDSNVRIHDDVILGNNCCVKAGAVLGGDGFGFEKDPKGNLFRFPQIGGLKIGDFVEIGANTCIDRGALSDTIIGDYTKINNLCHIAHNNRIGKNVVITAEVNVSGSNIIEDDVWIAPNSSIRGFIHIGKGATIGMGAVVISDVPSMETWGGCPAKKIRP